MGLFRPYEQGKHEPAGATKTKRRPADAVEPAPQPEEAPATTRSAEAAPEAPRTPRRKEGPTPSRAEAEAARMERLHPTVSAREQRRRSRSMDRVERQRRYNAIESRPERALLRDYVDARWTISEFALPLAILLMAVSMGGARWPAVVMGTSYAMTAFLALIIFNLVMLWYGFRKELRKRLPGAQTKGMVPLLLNRAITIRRFRNPPARIARGQSF